MNTTNFKLIWRNLWKNANISAINIIGLSVSLAICALIALYLQFEYSFDKSNPAHENFYRLTTTFKYPNSPERTSALTSPMMGPYLKRESGKIEEFLRVYPDNENFIVRANGKEITVGKNCQVDSTFFSFFNYPLLFGEKENAFGHPSNILISKKINEDLYGGQNSIGEMLEYTFSMSEEKDTTVQYLISGVFDELPKNSHLQFDALTQIDSRQFEGRRKHSLWHGVYMNTYFRADPSENDGQKIAAEFPELLKKEMPSSEMIGLAFQPFSEIHLGSMPLEYDGNNFQKTDGKYMKVLALVAFFILLISSINFANLSTALAMRRVQEVGVRKSLGATNGNVLSQFLGEAVLMSIIGGGLALIWVELLQPVFLSMLGKNVELNYSPLLFLAYIGAVILLGILAGIFPAVQAARYSAVEAFQQRKTAVSVKRPFVQRLVVLQFMLSGMLIIGTLISHYQLSFLQNKDLGFQYTQVIEMNMDNGLRAAAMKKELAAIPGVLKVAGSDMSIGTIDTQNGVLVRDQETQEWENYPMSINRADHHYFDLYEMEFIHGRSLSAAGAASGKEFVVNESFLQKVGWTGDPLGREIWRAGQQPEDAGKLVGVIKDIHHNSLHHEIVPICIQASDFSPIISMKINPADISNVLEKSQTIWNRHIKDKPFDYQFKDEHFAQIYMAENRMGRLLLAATFLSIFISCLGLLALSAFIIQQRTKEIGIRKVLGATTAGIVTLLSKDFLKLVGIAFLIAIPVSYFFMEKWLQDFAYRITIEWWVFALAALLVTGVAFLTVSFQSIKAALVNPVESLRSE